MSASSITAQRLARSQQRHAGVEKYAASTEASSKFTVAPPTAPLDTFCSKVVERCGPAVVKILTEREREAEDSDLMELLEQLFSGAGGGEVFIGADGIVIGDGRHGSGGHHSRNRRRRKRSVMRGQGSGFLIDSAGTILTNAHVVKGASVVKVLLTTGQQLIGEVRGLDSVLDVAVVSVAAPPTLMLPAAIPLSDGSRLKVGQWAISIGNPLGLNNSVSLGVLSSLLPSTETALDWVSHDHLQTDAAINQGNSGGPLLNERGEAIGLVHAKAGGMHTEGVGFAIPMRVILPLLPHLASGRIIQHAMLGVQMCDAHAEAAELGERAPEQIYDTTTHRSSCIRSSLRLPHRFPRLSLPPLPAGAA